LAIDGDQSTQKDIKSGVEIFFLLSHELTDAESEREGERERERERERE
jgi:hypothetical protein